MLYSSRSFPIFRDTISAAISRGHTRFHALCNEWYTHDIAHYASDRCNSLLRSLPPTYVFAERERRANQRRSTAVKQSLPFSSPRLVFPSKFPVEQLRLRNNPEKAGIPPFFFFSNSMFRNKRSKRDSRKFAFSTRISYRLTQWQVCICNRTVCRVRYMYIYIYIHIYTFSMIFKFREI